ncbi:MAG: YdcF family protein [Lentisphaerae bacterium]|nr:YdcF family protein [Lentisphaerota bacterium]
MNLATKAIAFLLVLPFEVCRGEPAAYETGRFDTVLIVLGNEPLDDSTPTVDMVARVTKAVEFQKQHLAALLVFTGGPTAGTNSEARMMANLAIAQGVATNAIRLEEKARSTQENARLTAALIGGIRPRRILIVSKGDHLEWAMPIFRKEAVFKSADPLACNVAAADSIAQMKAYLALHPDNLRVQKRLQKLESGRKGTD